MGATQVHTRHTLREILGDFDSPKDSESYGFTGRFFAKRFDVTFSDSSSSVFDDYLHEHINHELADNVGPDEYRDTP